jgi:hypothetical protein
VKRHRTAALALALLALVAIALGCGGGGGGGGGPTTPPTPTPVSAITFTPSGTGGANSLALTRVQSSQTSITLSLEATSVTDLYGIAFDLAYPSAALRFDAITEGSFLDQSGAIDTSLQVAENPPGTLIVGLSRLGQVAGRSGTGSVLRLEFSRVAAGSGDLTFANNRAFNATGAVISGVQWSAGQVVVP